jgi:hypothetical protein
MLGRTAGALLLAAAVCSVVSCRKIETPTGAAAIPSQSLRGTTSIPANWGQLVSVSSETTNPDLVQLWFQDNSGTIRMVVYRLKTGELLNVRLFRRQ